MRVLTPDAALFFLQCGDGMECLLQPQLGSWKSIVGPIGSSSKCVFRSNFHGEDPPLADLVWEQLQQHFVYRLALELDDIPLMHSFLLGQLVVLQKKITEHDGVMRVCGLSPMNQRVLELHGLGHQMPNYYDRNEAVMASRVKPR